MKNKLLPGHIAAVVTILIWGTTFISTKVLLRAFSPVEILVFRFVTGYAALWCVCPRFLKVKDRKQEYYFAAAGFCGVTLYYLLENMALSYTLASNVGVIISIAPFFTVLFTCLFLHEGRPGARFFAGFVVAMAGICLISFSKPELKINPAGDLLAVAAAVVWAGYSTLTKKVSSFGYSTILTTRRTFFYGLVLMIPVTLFADVRIGISRFADMTMLLNFLFLGFGASALCFVTWNLAVKILGSVKTTVYIYMVPVITSVTSVLVLHEQMTGRTVAGIILTMAGLFLSQNRNRESESGEKKRWMYRTKNV